MRVKIRNPWTIFTVTNDGAEVEVVDVVRRGEHGGKSTLLLRIAVAPNTTYRHEQHPDLKIVGPHYLEWRNPQLRVETDGGVEGDAST